MKPVSFVLVLWGAILLGAETPPSAVERLGFTFSPPKEPNKPGMPDLPAAPGTVVLPKFDVKDSRIKLTKDDVLSPTDKLIDAKREYISPLYAVTFGPLSQLAGYFTNFLSISNGWHPNTTEAVVLYVQDARLRKIAEFDRLAELEVLADPSQLPALHRLRAETFRQPQKDESLFYRIDIQHDDQSKTP
jgi:hypothetical protein